MKKTYINPSLEVVKIATQQMLAVSNRGFSGDAATTTNNEYDDARSFDFDDEE